MLSFYHSRLSRLKHFQYEHVLLNRNSHTQVLYRYVLLIWFSALRKCRYLQADHMLLHVDAWTLLAVHKLFCLSSWSCLCLTTQWTVLTGHLCTDCVIRIINKKTCKTVRPQIWDSSWKYVYSPCSRRIIMFALTSPCNHLFTCKWKTDYRWDSDLIEHRNLAGKHHCFYKAVIWHGMYLCGMIQRLIPQDKSESQGTVAVHTMTQ